MGIVNEKHIPGDDMRTVAEFNHFHASLNSSSHVEEHA